MQNLTPADEVKDRWLLEEDFPVPDETLEKLIGDAEDTIEGEFPGLRDKVLRGDDQFPEHRVHKIVARMVLRLLRNPEGVRTIQESTGPWGGSTTLAGDDPGEMYLTDKDRKELRGERTRSGRAFTVPTVRW